MTAITFAEFLRQAISNPALLMISLLTLAVILSMDGPAFITSWKNAATTVSLQQIWWKK